MYSYDLEKNDFGLYSQTLLHFIISSLFYLRGKPVNMGSRFMFIYAYSYLNSEPTT